MSDLPIATRSRRGYSDGEEITFRHTCCGRRRSEGSSRTTFMEHYGEPHPLPHTAGGIWPKQRDRASRSAPTLRGTRRRPRVAKTSRREWSCYGGVRGHGPLPGNSGRPTVIGVIWKLYSDGARFPGKVTGIRIVRPATEKGDRPFAGCRVRRSSGARARPPASDAARSSRRRPAISVSDRNLLDSSRSRTRRSRECSFLDSILSKRPGSCEEHGTERAQ